MTVFIPKDWIPQFYKTDLETIKGWLTSDNTPKNNNIERGFRKLCKLYHWEWDDL